MHITLNSDIQKLPSVAQATAHVYAFVVRRRSATPEEICAGTGMDEAAALLAIQTLEERGLLRLSPDGRRLLGVAPDSARMPLLGPLLRDRMAIQERIDRIRGDLDALTPVYEANIDQQSTRQPHEEVANLTVVRSLIAEFSASAELEVLTSQPGGGRREELLAGAIEPAKDVLAHGARMRTLYQHTAQFDQATIAYVEQVTELGAEVRTTVAGCARMLVFDRRVAVLPLKDHPKGAVIVRDKNVIATLVDVFERIWSGAQPFPLKFSKRQAVSAASEVRGVIVGLLMAGESDKKIAQHVGLSLRTCQRHIADIMIDLGAQNRLHAGYLLGRGHVAGGGSATTCPP
ncbi:hypothetical protein [Streptomyces sp. NPDC059552]|uniref:hypothetical protein n=1 Tax=Streptomyces sp. NPDC059552 TaxID=3346862 RepID=UPI0036A09DBC